MKRHAVIPVMYDSIGETVLRSTTPSDDIVRALCGDKFADEKYQPGARILENCLDAGWSIVSVQSAPIPGGNESGKAIFVYILESPEIN